MIEREDFLAWARAKFSVIQGEGGKDIKVDSPFSPGDDGCNLWICPEKNAYHCWKSGESGNLFELVAHVDGCSYAEAKEILRGSGSVRALEQRVRAQFSDKPIGRPKAKIELPPQTLKLTAIRTENPWRRKAEAHLKKRLMPIEGFYVCTAGTYRDRLIIPYYGPGGELIYWNGRTLGNAKAKYRGPEKDKCGIGKADVLYMHKWPDTGARVYLTEGEFDSLSLWMCGFHSAAIGGKELSDTHMDLLAPYRLCISLDADDSGGEALHIIQAKLARRGIEGTTFVRPPKCFKDWNKMLIDVGQEAVATYIRKEEKPLNFWVSAAIKLFKNYGR